MPTYATLDDWIVREAIPFSLDSPEALNAAVGKVMAALGDSVELLGFGEGLPAPAVAALPVRSGSLKNQSYFPLTAQSLVDFDWLAVLDSITYTRGGSPLP